MILIEFALLTTSNCFLLGADVLATIVMAMIPNIPSNSTFHCLMYLQNYFCKDELLMAKEKEISFGIY